MGTPDVDGQKLRQARENKLWTIAELSRRSGVSADTIRRAETNKRSPRRIVQLRLARALDVEVDALHARPTEPTLLGVERLQNPGGLKRKPV